MSLGTFLSRILGFFRDLLLASAFSKNETDIFFVAFRFPNFFRRLLGEGTFSASITPALTESLEKNQAQTKHRHARESVMPALSGYPTLLESLEKNQAQTKHRHARESGYPTLLESLEKNQAEEAKKLHHSFFSLLFSLSLILTLLGVIFMPWIIRALFENSPYGQIPGKLEKTILVGRIVFSYLFFVSLYSYFMSVAQVFGRFFVPALAPAFFNLSLIFFALLPQKWWPFPSMALAWAVLLGGLLQLIPVWYLMKKLKWSPRFSFQKNPALFKLLKRVFPSMLALSGLSFIGLINVYFAGKLEEGANSYIYYADRLMEFPRSLIAVSLGTALIPELTRQYTNNNREALKKTLNYYLRFLLFLSLPFALLFGLQADFIIQLLFGRGQFDQSSVGQTAEVLKIYTLFLIFSSLARVLSSTFFAINKSGTVVKATGIFVLAHFIFAGFLSSRYGLEGLAGASSLSSLFFFLVLLLFYKGAGSFFNFGDLKIIGNGVLNLFPGLLALALSLQILPQLLYRLHWFLFLHFNSTEGEGYESLDSSSLMESGFYEASKKPSSLLETSFSEASKKSDLTEIGFYEAFKNPPGLLETFDLNYISSYPLYSFLIFGISCGLGSFLYLKISLLLKDEMGQEFLKLLYKFKNLFQNRKTSLKW